jgi:hypothetical protein
MRRGISGLKLGLRSMKTGSVSHFLVSLLECVACTAGKAMRRGVVWLQENDGASCQNCTGIRTSLSSK